MKRSGEAGFTLVEMLVVIAILGVVLLAVSNTFISSSRTTTLAVARAELQQETVNAQQLIASRVKEAWYVFPPGVAMALNDTALRRNPITSNKNWTVATHPILAMILPPRNPALACASATNDGCYRFFAYYPVLRSVWVAGTSGASNPGADAANDASTWVLAEYRDYYYESNPSTTSPASLTLPPIADSDANLVSDYIMPTTTAGATYTMFGYTPATAATTGVTGVNINLATGRVVNGKLTRLPGQTGTYNLSVYPLNLGKVAAN
ncbi:PilW family protein [Deinococcus radiopugnans]|uniref:Prepilin-type N-terminal cleavage/methylation domain-containing protein n=1 Tax=Deinococcus radiopugnans ATCC 19172 TaxID=585398 RepID=A0A5C4Y8N1_9DEIO|nr:type II secretion system protein [Deinococcus radiopugnans]MBB6016428.1 prepilin-type N-terminal cleavage/methylation domain-containing protein [Deinococcus radiopugnans ATCC 19172]TNM71383.1 type II secretion system protein [Deinococcus radiopugnans ATCC 19172]